MLQLYDRTELVAEISLIDDNLRVVSFAGDWVKDLLEEMRDGRSDVELFRSLPIRLRGHVWVGEKV